jgi:Ca2+-binding EF-hand superfamily protein
LQNHAEGEEDVYQKIMATVDLDGDGKIDYLEFIQGAINHKSLLNKENIKIIFDMID